MRIDYNQYAARALAGAREDALAFRQKYIGTEHLMLGLMKDPDALSCRVLEEAGVTYENFSDAVLGEAASLGQAGDDAFIGYSPKASHVLEVSSQEASRMEADQVGTEHILMALLKEKDCIAMRILKGMGISRKKLFVDILLAAGMDQAAAQNEYKKVFGKRKAAGGRPWSNVTALT